MNKNIPEHRTSLTVTAVIIWLVFLLGLLIPAKSTWSTYAPRDAILPELWQLATLYLGLSAVLLTLPLLTRRNLSEGLLHVQALSAFLPSTFFVAGGAFLSYAILRLGYIPRPNRPDPSVIGAGMYQFGIVWISLLTVTFVGYVILYHRGSMVWPRCIPHSIMVHGLVVRFLARYEVRCVFVHRMAG
jgi:hypothetical protein